MLHLYVELCSRRKGAARSALPLLVSSAWRLGVTAILCLVPSGNDAKAARSLLTSAGFAPLATRRDVEGPLPPGRPPSATARLALYRLERARAAG